MEDLVESIGRFCSGILLRLGISFGSGIGRTYDRTISLTRRKHHDEAIFRDICTVLDRTGRSAAITPKKLLHEKKCHAILRALALPPRGFSTLARARGLPLPGDPGRRHSKRGQHHGTLHWMRQSSWTSRR